MAIEIILAPLATRHEIWVARLFLLTGTIWSSIDLNRISFGYWDELTAITQVINPVKVNNP